MDIKINSKYALNTLGMLALVVFSIFVLISALLYPTPYTPLYDWLSNLGNADLNPSGALFFNWGCIITAIILILFFTCLYRWNPISKRNKLLLFLGIFFGIFACISLIGVGIFPETHIQMHVLAASGVFGSLFIIIILLSTALFNHPKFMHIVAYWGIIAVLINISFVTVMLIPQFKGSLGNFHPTLPIPGLEWACAFSSIIWIGLLSYNMWKKNV